MKVSINWLEELLSLDIPLKELLELIPLRTPGGVKEITDNYFELDIKGYNRGDLLSLRGVALELAALTDSKINFTDQEQSDFSKFQSKSSPKVAIENPKLSPLYALVKIEGLRVKPSSADWVSKLESSGMRSVNNLTDVTNIVMLEFGQPLHAFDTNCVTGEKIIVRQAKQRERVVTLDEKVRILEQSDILITDPKKILGIAGVMGGKNSEVSDSTTSILLEAAIFDPGTIRKTSTRLGLHSEASKRFQHGLTKIRLFQGLDAAISMYQNLGGKVTEISIFDQFEDKKVEVEIHQDKINSLIGVDISPKQVEEYLEKLGFVVSSRLANARSNNNFSSSDAKLDLAKSRSSNNQAWLVTPPYYRLDIDIEEDVIEEIARLYGYEKIPAKELKGVFPQKIDQSLFEFISNLKQQLVNLGLTEVQTYSYYSSQVLSALYSDNISKRPFIKIANPMSAETEYMRIAIFPNLVEVIEKNLRQGFKDIAIFEIGKKYFTKLDGSIVESYSLAIALMNGSNNPLAELYNLFAKTSGFQTGDAGEERFQDSAALSGEALESLKYKKTADSQSAEAYQILNEISQINKLSFEKRGVPEINKREFHPNRILQLRNSNKFIGLIAEVHPRILDKFGISQRVAIVELNLNNLA